LSEALAELLDSQLVMVTGKGGTGKTTFAAALALLGAVRGRRTVLCEIDTQRPSMAAVFDITPVFEPTEVRENLHVCNISWDEALQAYLRGMIPMRRVVRMILDNVIVGRFLDFTPGSQELVSLSIVGNLCDEYDLVVVDMPASGHAFSLLDVTRSAMGLFRSGPVRRRAGELVELLHKESSRLVYVALPEEMVVNETIETFQKFEDSKLMGGAPMVFLNRATLPSLTDDERQLLARLSASDLDPLQTEFVKAGRWEDILEQATARSMDRLGEALPIDPVMIPPANGVPRHVVGGVAVHLGRLVGVTRRELSWT
jgi:anion-transporting  ArsA/GET3 family ATPase